MSKEEIPVWAAAQTREKLEGMDPDELGLLLREAPMVPDQVVETLSILKREYDPDWDGAPESYDSSEDPRTVEQTERWNEITARWISKSLSTAIRNGRDRMVNAWLGVVEQETGIGEIQSYVRFENWVTREAGITYLAGHMGTGKTDFGLLMLEVFYESYTMSDKAVHIATNIQSCAENHDHVTYIDTQPDLQKWLESEDGYKLFVFDEASSHATGYSGDAAKVTQQFRSMIRLIRKSNGNMVIIGHDGKDLHPTVRELADYVEKEDKKEAAVFEAVEEREGVSKKFDVDSIPQTSYWYDTKEASEWEWATEKDADGKSLEVIIGETYEKTELTQSEVAEIYEVSQSKVSECKGAYHDWAAAEA